MWQGVDVGCSQMINQACMGVGRCVARYVKVDVGVGVGVCGRTPPVRVPARDRARDP